MTADLYRADETGSRPVILVQDPYNKNLMAASFTLEILDDPLLKDPDYAFVVMDWRGYFGSADAAYLVSPTRGQDGSDAVEWIANQPWCDGNVGTWGASALGAVQFDTVLEHPPALKACVPIVALFREWYEVYYPGGVYYRNVNRFKTTYFAWASCSTIH